jgi:hypothetical protein
MEKEEEGTGGIKGKRKGLEKKSKRKGEAKNLRGTGK